MEAALAAQQQDEDQDDWVSGYLPRTTADAAALSSTGLAAALLGLFSESVGRGSGPVVLLLLLLRASLATNLQLSIPYGCGQQALGNTAAGSATSAATSGWV